LFIVFRSFLGKKQSPVYLDRSNTENKTKLYRKRNKKQPFYHGPDQAGCLESPPGGEIRRDPLPSARMMYIALFPVSSDE
jgi:hypothetical protein